jgi:Uma2 family endonuclease
MDEVIAISSASVAAVAEAQGVSLATPISPPLYRLFVAQYHAMLGKGILTEHDRVELIEGVLFQKMGQNPPHSLATGLLADWLSGVVGAEYFVCALQSVTTLESEPEPDLTVIRGKRRDFSTSHPSPQQVALLAEISDSTLTYDRTVKKGLYARAGIPIYWIVNLVESRIEVYTAPSGPTPAPDYAECRVFAPTDEVALVMDGKPVGKIGAKELLP